MKDVRLNQTCKNDLQKASRTAVLDCFQTPSNAIHRNRWLRQQNRYRQDCANRYYKDVDPLLATPLVDHSAMASYIAASGPTHVVDAWSLLGRAVDALLRNDNYSAIHFGYYCELRAAMGLLATEGVGILSNRHPILEAAGTSITLSKVDKWDSTQRRYKTSWANTHALVWPCLDYWAGLARSMHLINSVFRPAQHGLSDWLTRLGSVVSPRAVVQKWLSIWGIDVSYVDDDHRSRNFVSYRPSEFRRPLPRSLDDSLDFVRDLWTCFEPASLGSFPNLERHLLRRALQHGRVQFPIAIGSLSSLGLAGGEEAAWLNVLNSTDEPRVFSDAVQNDDIESPLCALQVISRAALLLSVATAAARHHLKSSGLTAQQLRFWWHRHGVEKGLWEDADDIEPVDLWADVQQILDDINDWRLSNANSSLCRWRRSSSPAVELLGAFELVAVWGLLP